MQPNQSTTPNATMNERTVNAKTQFDHLKLEGRHAIIARLMRRPRGAKLSELMRWSMTNDQQCRDTIRDIINLGGEVEAKRNPKAARDVFLLRN